MSVYKLIYFPARGRAEPIRYMLAFSGASFEDIRIPYDQWANEKRKYPFGQLPVLQFDGKTLAQAFTIARFLGNRLHLNVDNHFEQAQLDALVDRTVDLSSPLVGAFREKDPVKTIEMVRSIRAEVIVPGLKFYEDWLAKSGNGWFGSKLTWTDFVLCNSFEGLQEMCRVDFSSFPKISEFMQRVLSLPNVKEYREKNWCPYSFYKPPEGI